jgi:hypothetical protein
MNINFDLNMWSTDIQWLLWKIFVRARESLANGTGWNESRVKTAFFIALQQFTPGAVAMFTSLYKPPLNISVDDVIVRDFPHGELHYSQDMKSVTIPWDSIHGKVLVHPDGHCSAFYKRLLAVGKDWFPIYNVQKYRRADLLSKGTLSLDLVTDGQAQNLNPYETFDQVLVDYVHFWDGTIQTTNNDLYNDAYGHGFNLDLYNQTLQVGVTPNNQVGLLQDGLYIPFHFINATGGVLATNFPPAYYSTPPGVSSTRLSAAFV